jgi:D-tyrosyl-tRNA(Tyr) deacylase
MKTVIQRVKHASVEVEGAVVGAIDHGLLALVGVEKTDTQSNADSLIKKLIGLRIFSDAAGKMNLSLGQAGGGILVVSQFTLAADLSKGYRPGFSGAAPPNLARELYLYVLESLRSHEVQVEAGIFAADMKVSLLNDGPVTFVLDT